MYFTEFKPQKRSDSKGGYSSRPTIVLLHGAGGSQLSWPVEIRRLSGYRVIALDLPGHGKSIGIASQNMEDYSQAVSAFLRELGIFSLVLVGHSLGSAIAIDFARKNPDQVRALALLSAAVRFTIPQEIFQAVSDAETYPIGLAKMKQCFFSPRTLAAIRNRIMLPLEKQRSTILYSDLLASAGVDLRRGTSLLSCPVWIASGRQDLITPPSVSWGLNKLIQTAEFNEIPAAGHMLPLEQPAAVANGLQDFLGRYNHF